DRVDRRRRCGRAAAGRSLGRLHRLPRVAVELPSSGAAPRRRALLLRSSAARQLSTLIYRAGRRGRRVREPAAAGARDVRPRRARHRQRTRADRGGAVIGTRHRVRGAPRAWAATAVVAAALSAVALVGATLASLEP